MTCLLLTHPALTLLLDYQGVAMAETVGAVTYVECSALTGVSPSLM